MSNRAACTLGTLVVLACFALTSAAYVVASLISCPNPHRAARRADSAGPAGSVGFDRPYFDLPGMPVAAATPTACAALCDANANCFSWGYALDGTGNNCFLKSVVAPLSVNAARVSGVKGASLRAPRFRRLPLGAVRPAGWLAQQLTMQAQVPCRVPRVDRAPRWASR
jgi:hypothetical protein